VWLWLSANLDPDPDLKILLREADRLAAMQDVSDLERIFIGGAQCRAGRYERARKNLTAWAKWDRNPAVCLLVATCDARAGKTDDARRLMQQADKVAADDQDWRTRVWIQALKPRLTNLLAGTPVKNAERPKP
jgi:hypothetical protein